MLDKPLTLSTQIHPICLSDGHSMDISTVQETGWVEEPKKLFHPSPYHYFEDLRQRNDLSFGFENTTWSLRVAESTLQPQKECQDDYKFLKTKGISIVESMICASPLTRVSCSFKGNSGAPLFVNRKDDSIVEQVGIVSWGKLTQQHCIISDFHFEWK